MSLNINNVLINNFNNVCRTCSQKTDLVSLHENIYLIEMLITSAQIQIQLNDELPKNICLNCIKDLNQSYAFISKCKASDSVFRQCLTQQKLLNIKENDKRITKINHHHHQQQNKNNIIETTTTTTTEEIFIKTEISDNEEYNNQNDSISDECSKDSSQQEFEPPQSNKPETTTTTKPQQQQQQLQTENYENHCSDCNQSFATNTEFILHFNDCQFKNLLIPMEQEESSDDEFPDDSGTNPPDKSNLSLEGECDTEDIKIVSLNNLPETSKKKYEMAYKLFMEWHKEQNITAFTENVLMAYFSKISKQYKATTLWTHYSMLRTTININNNVDISHFVKVRAFLKRQSQSHKPRKSKTFTRTEINRFIWEAPDQEYLLIKVAFIMGIMGACRRSELHRMETTHINDLGSAVLVTLPDTKTKIVRRFTITGKFYEIFRKYADLRPSHAKDTPFFLNYQKGKCTIQRVGINKFGSMGKQVAQFLKLPNPELYTGHCLRRSSTTIRLDA